MPRSMKPQDAARLLGTEQARARAKIQVGNTVETITNIMNGTDERSHPNHWPARVAAARLLLAKTLPDLSQVDVKGTVDGTITITIKKLA